MVKTEDDVDRGGESVMHVFLYNGRDGTGAATSRKQLRLGLRAAVTAVIDSTCYLYSPTYTIHPLLFRLGSIRRSSNYSNIAFTYRVLLFLPSFNPRAILSRVEVEIFTAWGENSSSKSQMFLVEKVIN